MVTHTKKRCGPDLIEALEHEFYIPTQEKRFMMLKKQKLSSRLVISKDLALLILYWNLWRRWIWLIRFINEDLVIAWVQMGGSLWNCFDQQQIGLDCQGSWAWKGKSAQVCFDKRALSCRSFCNRPRSLGNGREKWFVLLSFFRQWLEFFNFLA